MSSPIVNEELRYNEEPLPLGSRRRVAQFENNQGTITGGNTAYIRIPSLRNSYLDTGNASLTFTVESTLTGTILPIRNGATGITNPDQVKLSASGAVSFIRTIRIMSNNELVCQIDNANKIAAILQVANQSYEGQDAMSVLSGQSHSSNANLIGNGTSRIYGFPTTASTATLSTTPKMTFTINNQILAVLGDGCMLPIHALKNGIELQVEFETDARLSYVAQHDAADATKQSTITSGTNSFSNIRYSCAVVELDDSSMVAVNRENGFGSRDVMWSGVNYHASIQKLSAAQLSAAGTYTSLVPSNRFTSLKYLLLGGFDDLAAGSGTVDLNIPSNPLASLQYRMNGREFPIQKIDTVPKIVNNTIACFSNVSTSVGQTLMMTSATTLNYRQAANAANVATRNRAVLGVNLECWSESDAISGLDVSQSDTEVLLETTAVAATVASNLCFVSAYDVIYIINPDGVLKSSYK